MILTVAGATLRESLRSRSFIGLLSLFVVFMTLSRLIGYISATDGDLVTTDIVLSLQSIIGLLVAVATGTALMHMEIQQRTLYTVLSRPIARWQFVIGKFCGLAAALLCGQLAMLTLSLIYLWVTGAPVTPLLVLAGLLTAEEVVIMAAVSLCWTTLSTPLLAAALSLATYGLGHAVHELPGFLAYVKNDTAQWLIAVLASLMPDLGRYAYRNQAVHGLGLAPAEAAMTVAYGLLWIALLLTVTLAIFRRRQL
ncbi:MAG: ABC transporter permease [Planctomycetota bacterium]